MKYVTIGENHGCLVIFGYGDMNIDDFLEVLDGKRFLKDIMHTNKGYQQEVLKILEIILTDLSQTSGSSLIDMFNDMNMLVGKRHAILFFGDYISDEDLLRQVIEFINEQERIGIGNIGSIFYW